MYSLGIAPPVILFSKTKPSPGRRLDLNLNVSKLAAATGLLLLISLPGAA